MKKTNAALIAAVLAAQTVAPYAAAQSYELRSVYVQMDGKTYVFPATDMADLLAQGKRVTHVEISTGHVFAIGDYAKAVANAKNKPASEIFEQLIADKKYLSPSEVKQLQASYDGKVETDDKDGNITVTVPEAVVPSEQPLVVSSIKTMRDVPNAVSVRFASIPKNIEQRITGELIELEHNGEVFRLMYAKSGVYDNEAIYRVIDGKRLRDNVRYNVRIIGTWATTDITTITVQNETPYVTSIEGPNTVDASIVVNDKFDYAELRYVGVTQYGDTTELPSTTVLEKVVLDGKTLAKSDYTFRGGVLTLKNKLMPKSTIETTFSFKVKGRTERTTLTTTVNEFAPAEAARVELALDTTKPFYEGQDMTVKAKVFDQYGEEMKTAQVDWQVGSLQLTGGLTEKVTLQNSGSVVVTATVNGKTASQTITVLAAPKPAKIEVAVTPGNYFNGDDLPVTAKVFDQHGTEMRNQKVDWTVGDTKKLAGNQSDVLTLQNEGDVKITAKIGEVTGETTIEVKPTPTLDKISFLKTEVILGDNTTVYQPMVGEDTKGRLVMPTDLKNFTLTPNDKEAKLVLVKKSGNAYIEVGKEQDATAIALKIDVNKYTQEGENKYTVVSVKDKAITAEAQVQVKPKRVLEEITVVPNSQEIAVDNTVQVTVTPRDQYGAIYITDDIEVLSEDDTIIAIAEDIKPVKVNGVTTHYIFTVRADNVGESTVKVKLEGKETTAKFKVQVPKITKIQATSSRSFTVQFDSALTFLSANAIKVSGAGAIKRVTLSKDGKTAQVELLDKLLDKKEYPVEVSVGGVNTPGKLTYTIGEVAKIELASQEVVQGRKLHYKVFNQQGVDITDEVTLLATTEEASDFVVSNGQIRLAATASGEIPLQLRYVDAKGKVTPSSQVKVTVIPSEPEPTTVAAYWTLKEEKSKLLPVKDADNQVNRVELSNKETYLHVSLQDQFGDDIKGVVQFQTLNASILVVDKTTGLLTPEKEGAASVKVEAVVGGKVVATKDVRITVTKDKYLKTIEASSTEANLVLGGIEDAKQTEITLQGLDQFKNDFDFNDLQLEVADSTIVKADLVDTTIKVTALKEGTTVVTVRDGNVKRDIKVNVKTAQDKTERYEIVGVKDLAYVQEEGTFSEFTLAVHGFDAAGVAREALKPEDYTVIIKDALGKEVKAPNQSVKDYRDKKLAGEFTAIVTLTNQKDEAGLPIELKQTFHVIDNRIMPIVEVIDDEFSLRATQDIKFLDELKQHITVTNGKGTKIKDEDITAVTFTSTEQKVIEHNGSTLAGDEGVAVIYLQTLTVKDGEEEYKVPMYNYPITLTADKTPPTLHSITGKVEAGETAFVKLNDMTIKAPVAGTAGNDFAIELKAQPKISVIERYADEKGEVNIDLGFSKKRSVWVDVFDATGKRVENGKMSDEEATVKFTIPTPGKYRVVAREGNENGAVVRELVLLVQPKTGDKNTWQPTIDVQTEGKKITVSYPADATAQQLIEALKTTTLIVETPEEFVGTKPLTVGEHKLEGGTDVVKTLTLTYSEALTTKDLKIDEFIVDGTTATKVTPSGDNDLLILTFATPLDITGKETLDVEIPKLKDAVGNEQPDAQKFSVTIKDGKLQLTK